MPTTKKRKSKGGKAVKVDDAETQALLDRQTWKGWVEVESEPAYFNVILRELGVEGVKIQEVLGLDDEAFAMLPKPVNALIFLFEYQGNDASQQETECPGHVWFANQVPDFSCASVALLNIVNNISGLHLGPELQSFKRFTSEMAPLDRGYAIDDFEFLRGTHNSFARNCDILQANLVLKEKHEKRKAKAKADKARQTRMAKKVEADSQAAESGMRRSGRKRKARVDLQADDEAEGDDSPEAGNHFIAYLPIGNQVWKMDGMDRFPQLVGQIGDRGGWLDLARQAIVARIQEYPEGQNAFNLMAVVGDPFDAAKRSLDLHDAAVERRSRESDGHRVEDDFRNDTPNSASSSAKAQQGADQSAVNSEKGWDGTHTNNLTGPAQHDPGNHAEVESQPKREFGPSAILPDAEIDRLRYVVAHESAARAEDDQKALLRRHDYGPFLTAWAEALKEEDWFDPLIAMAKDA
ncbi:Ubiquitin carboxyl-terminal hydrolase isozyme L5 [Sphaceloma murrayae]|uniref:Ubiquitin carboxyl-terminal hydrolase n=1 Tax=Sphaceloma murrayae TaxID=2082308 RepID=A0A2K1R1U6_9PEZI|nr:Ubiquitin carboxyl-terminal hydrolase isozyme L5 [Sphaceloma murrayae]